MKSGEDVYGELLALTETGEVYNYTAEIDLSTAEVVTERFPSAALAAYTRYNLGDTAESGDEAYFDSLRGGAQGDYRDGMPAKIEMVVDCLRRFPESKRAVLTVSNHPLWNHEDDASAKCLREVHFHRAGPALNATCIMRAQAAEIFPKNLHFLAGLTARIAKQLPDRPRPGQLFYLATRLVRDR